MARRLKRIRDLAHDLRLEPFRDKAGAASGRSLILGGLEREIEAALCVVSSKR